MTTHVTQRISLRADDDLVTRLDDYQERHGLKHRAEAVRSLLKKALDDQGVDA